MKLQSKIFLAVFPFIVIPLLFSGGIAYQRLQKNVETTLNSQIQTLFQQITQQLDAFEQTAKANVNLFSSSKMMRAYMNADEDQRYGMLQPYLMQRFNRYHHAYPNYIEIRVILPDGYEDTRFAPKYIPNLTEEENESEFFQVWLKNKQEQYVDYTTMPDTGDFILHIAQRLYFTDTNQKERKRQAKGEFKGFLAISAKLSGLKAQSLNQKIGQQGRIFFVDKNAKILFEDQDITLQTALRTGMRQKNNIQWFSPEGLYYRGQKLRNNLWVFASVPTLEMSTESQRLGLEIASITLITILISLWLLMSLLGRLLLDPIRDLSQATEHLGKGNMETALLIRSNDELGVLSRGFNRMVAQLKQTQAQKDTAQAEALANQEQAINNLKQADKLKDEFLANTSHELRTPLNGIIGIGQSLLDGVGGKVNDIQAQNLRMIVQSGQRLTTLVNDILDSFKMRTQKLQLQRRPVDMYAMASLAIELSRALLQGKNIELINQVDSDLPAVYADENRLQQILLNLIGNAIKFTHQGQISIRAELLDEQQMCIFIDDTGIGIAADKHERIFQAFEQADGSTAREYGGTGLGLSVTRELVHLHQGEISLSSEENQGSSFRFTLPLSTEALKQEQCSQLMMNVEDSNSQIEINQLTTQKPILNANGDIYQVLVVDDETVNLQVLVNYLSQENYQLSLATSGQEVLDLLDKGYAPDLVILDVMMPRMTGFEVTQHIRQQWALHELPILLLTAKNQAQDVVTGLDTGANDYLIKPVAKEELLARMRTHLAIKHLKASREQALEAARLKAKFLANMSHEIRTPMNAIIGVGDLLNDTSLNAEQKDYVSTICSGSETLLALINDIVDFSKIEANKLELDLEPFSLYECIEKVIDIVKELAHQKNLNLAYWIDWQVPEYAIGDSYRLRQILINLLNNAVKFTHEGEVFIRVEALPSDNPKQHFVKFSVRDTGIGISTAHQAKLFQSFNQADTKITRNYGGSGLGLAISKALAELMQGEVGIDSVEGQGATFHFSIYLDKLEQAQQDSPWRSQQTLFVDKQLLIYEPNQSNRTILENLLQHWGAKTQCLDNDAFTVENLSEQTVDAALISPHQAEFDWQTLQQNSNYPLVLIHEHCHRHHLLKFFQSCFNKPLRPSHVYQSLGELLEHGTTQTQVSPSQQSADVALDSSKRILLVEDNKVNQRVALLVLKKLGLQADIANNGLEALEAIDNTAYDIILMDVRMPEMDGLEATRNIRERFAPEREKPWIIAMTASAMTEDKEACFDAGMNDYTSKPVRPQILQTALKQAGKKRS